ncbi:MAG: gliding motility-associated C-terminal domain-containing protein [Fulvivirga sp.]
MSRYLLTISLLLISGLTSAQLVVPQGTTFRAGTNTLITTNNSVANRSAQFNINQAGSGIVLAGSNQAISTTEDIVLPNLGITGGGIKTMDGVIAVTENLILDNGLVNTGNQLDLDLFVLGPNVSIDENGTNSYIVGPLVHLGGGDKFFPIGTASQYAPVVLYGITGSNDVATALLAAPQTGAFLPTTLEAPVDSASQNWFWGFLSEGLSSATIELPILPGDEGLTSGDNRTGVVLEVDTTTRLATNLGGVLSGNTIRSTSSLSKEVAYLMVGSSLVITPLIRNLITLNRDGQNDFLVIEDIDVYQNNEVILLDRWGTEVFSKSGFRNYDEFDNPYDGNFDFLEPGNYICIVKYAGRSIKQVITVLK